MVKDKCPICCGKMHEYETWTERGALVRLTKGKYGSEGERIVMDVKRKFYICDKCGLVKAK